MLGGSEKLEARESVLYNANPENILRNRNEKHMDPQKEELLKMMSWDASIQSKRKALNLALQQADFEFLILPKAHFNSWDFCANVFFLLSDEELQPYLFQLFAWLEDLNWPGAEKLELRLLEVSPEKLCSPLEQVVEQAVREGKGYWIENLARFWGTAPLTNQFSQHTRMLLQQAGVRLPGAPGAGVV